MADKHHNNKKKKHGLGYLSQFLDPRHPLSGHDLLRAAKAEARIQTQPQVHSYQRLAHELGREKRFEAKGLRTLGRKTASSVGTVYDTLANQAQQNLATQAALGSQLTSQTSKIGQGSEQALAQSQRTQTSALAKQGAATPGSPAQAQLAQIVASQNAAAANDAKAAQAFATSQAAGATQLSGNLATSSLLQGATAQAGIKNTVLNRIAESDLKYGQDIREARGKAADAKALKGSQIVQALQQLRGQEQQYLLGRAATNQRAQAAKLSAKTSVANSKRTAATAAKGRHQDAHQFNETHTPGGKSRGTVSNDNSQGQGQHQKKHWQKSIRHLAKPAIASKPPKYWKNPKHVAGLEHYIRTQGSFGGNEVNLVAHIVRRLLDKGGKKGHGGGHKQPPHNI